MLQVSHKGLELQSDLRAYLRFKRGDTEDFSNRERQRENEGRLWEDISLIARKICEYEQVLRQTWTLIDSKGRLRFKNH